MAEAIAVDPDETAQALCKLAETGGFDQLVTFVTEQNCNLRQPNDCMTPLMCAARANERPTFRHGECAELLLLAASSDGDHRKAKAELLNAEDLIGRTSLHHAAASDNVPVMEVLLRCGSAVNKKDHLGKTPLFIAVERNRTRAARLLLRAGADQELTDDQGRSPIHLVEDNLDMKRLLERFQPRPIPKDFEEIKQKRKLIECVVEGAFCALYQTETKPPNLPIVVRILKNQSPTRGVHQAEVQGLEALKITKHCNIAQHLKSEVTKETIEILLEKVEGRTLREVLNSYGPLGEVQIQKYVEQLACALCYLHNHPNGPIIHRDIRCENIMIGRVGALKLIDFGFALRIRDSTYVKNSVLCGVLRNMAPEVLEDESGRCGCEADIWAFGCVLYTMAMGKDPFCSNNLINLCREIDRGVPRIEPADKFSPELQSLYEKCMQKEPTARIRAVGILLHSFLKWGGSQCNKCLAIEKIKLLDRKMPPLIESLNELIDLVNKSNRNEHIAKVATTVASVGGDVMATVGFALLIPSFGAALPLAIAGTAVAVAGGAGGGAAALAGRIDQGGTLKNAQEKFADFQFQIEQLLFDQLGAIRYGVHSFVEENGLKIDFSETKSLVLYLKAELESVKEDLRKLNIRIVKNKKGAVEEDEMIFYYLIHPLDDLVVELEEIAKSATASSALIDRDLSNQFHRNLLKASEFLLKIVRIVFFGTSDDQIELYPEEIKTVLRSATGGTQVSLELATIAARSVGGRVAGIASSGAFVALDIGFLAYYSKKLHEARMGGNAERANPILCQIDIIRKIGAALKDTDVV